MVDWGKSYEVRLAYGDFVSTKSYGNFVLPAGEYEALRVIIGEGKRTKLVVRLISTSLFL